MELRRNRKAPTPSPEARSSPETAALGRPLYSSPSPVGCYRREPSRHARHPKPRAYRPSTYYWPKDNLPKRVHRDRMPSCRFPTRRPAARLPRPYPCLSEYPEPLAECHPSAHTIRGRRPSFHALLLGRSPIGQSRTLGRRPCCHAHTPRPQA